MDGWLSWPCWPIVTVVLSAPFTNPLTYLLSYCILWCCNYPVANGHAPRPFVSSPGRPTVGDSYTPLVRRYLGLLVSGRALGLKTRPSKRIRRCRSFVICDRWWHLNIAARLNVVEACNLSNTILTIRQRYINDLFCVAARSWIKIHVDTMHVQRNTIKRKCHVRRD